MADADAVTWRIDALQVNATLSLYNTSACLIALFRWVEPSKCVTFALTADWLDPSREASASIWPFSYILPFSEEDVPGLLNATLPDVPALPSVPDVPDVLPAQTWAHETDRVTEETDWLGTLLFVWIFAFVFLGIAGAAFADPWVYSYYPPRDQRRYVVVAPVEASASESKT